MTITNPPQPPHVCARCGTVLGTSGGRCPQCGEIQPEAPARPAAFQPPPFVPDPAPPAGSVAGRRRVIVATGAVLLIGASGIVAIGLLGTKAEEPGPREPKASATSTTSAAVKRADPDDMGIADLAAVRLREILPRASARAARWHREAQLVSIRASPVVKGKIDATSGGTLEIRFARPAGARLGPGARVSTEQLSILVDSRGSKVSPAKGVPGDSAAGLPICVLEQAWRTMVASGVPSDAKCTMRYAHSERHGKAVWTTTSDDDEKLTRTIDGRSCTIVVR